MPITDILTRNATQFPDDVALVELVPVEDSEKKRYNPILRLYNGNIPTEEQLSFMYDAIKLRLTVAESAFDLVSTENEMIENILKNILFIGIPDKTEEIMKKYENNENQRKEPSDD